MLAVKTRPQVLARPPRRIRQLRWAELREHGLNFKDNSKKACVKRGHSYERVVGRALKRMLFDGTLQGELFLSRWIMFSDQNGVGWAQPDAFILMDDQILLFECKLTQTETAHPQLLSLYLPLLRHIYNRPILCLQVCKNLRQIPKKFVESPRELLANPGSGVYLWHFRGDS